MDRFIILEKYRIIKKICFLFIKKMMLRFFTKKSLISKIIVEYKTRIKETQ